MKYLKLLLTLALAFTLCACGTASSGSSADVSELETTFGIDLSDASYSADEVKNTAGGFHGDGAIVSKITFDSDPAEAFSSWDKLPVSDEVTALFERFADDWGEAPSASNGCWKYVEESDDTEYSYNSRIAIYDADENILWYYIINT